MIRSNYVQVTRAKVTLVNRVYHRVSPARITRVRLGDTGYSLQKRITRVRLGDTGFSLQKCITNQNRCSPLKERIGNTITLEKPNGFQFKTSRYRNVVTRLVSESQWYTIVTKMYHRFRYKIVSPRWNGQSWIWSLLKRITRLRLGDTVSSLQNRITKPYLRLGDTLQLRSGYTREGDFSK